MRRNSDQPLAAPSKERKKPYVPETACVYFGRVRLYHVRARAKKLGQSFSTHVCSAIDLGMALDKDRLSRLQALATVRGVTPSDLLAQLIDGATKEAISKAAN